MPAQSRTRTKRSTVDLAVPGAPRGGSPTPGCASALQNLTSEPEGVPVRLPNESTDAYSRFLWWLASNAESGKRSLVRAADQFGLNEATLREQRDRYQWLDRAASFDRATIDRELGRSLDVQRRAIVAQVALAERLTKIIERVVGELEDREGGDPLDALAPALEAAKTLQRAQAALRLATGQSTSHATVEVFDRSAAPRRDYSCLTDAELLLVEKLEVIEKLVTGHSRAELSTRERTLLDEINGVVEVAP